MNEKFFRRDLDYYAIIPNEVNGITTYDIGEFKDSMYTPEPYYTYDLSLPSIEIAKVMCKATVEAFNDGRDSCECF